MEMKSILEGYREIIPEFSGFQESLKRPFPVHIRVNSLKIEPEKLIQAFDEKGVALRSMGDRNKTLFVAPGLKSAGNQLEYFTGCIHPQAFTSCLASIALSPEPESLVLDMCASPGGKTSHMAQLMKNTGLIVANELYMTRNIPLAHTLSRLGVLNAILTDYQAQEYPLRQRFDYVLADVPCSGEGRIRLKKGRKRVDWRSDLSHQERLKTLQKRIIVRGYDLLKDRGEMLYATCTYNPDENESIVDFLLKQRDAELLPIHVGFHYEPGITQWRDEEYDRRLELAARFYPHRTDSVGFFMARIVRRRG